MNFKLSIEDLALFGGSPCFDKKLHVGGPNIGSRERLLERIDDILERRWLTNNGPYVQEFEQRLAARLGVKHCVATCNATVALEILSRALGLSGEVIVPAFTFVATAHALRWLGIQPVFCDVDPRTHTIDVRQIESLISPRTTGILAVHLWGRPCRVEALTQLARQRGLKLLFDAAHAFGCSHRGRMIGNFGEAEVFSFHATKFFNAFEGGAITTNDDALAARLRLMRNFGFRDTDDVACLGTNGKMSEVSAAMGLTNLEDAESFVCANHRNYQAYVEGLEGVRGVRLLRYDGSEHCNFHYVILEVDEDGPLSRDELLGLLCAENIVARRYFYPGCHRLEPYRSENRPMRHLPNTDRLCRRVLALPNGTAVGVAEANSICELIRFAFEQAPRIRGRMRQPERELEVCH